MEARNYQMEIYEKAKNENVIIKLNTGSGKTFIASMLIKDYLYYETDKKIFFLVKNSSLAYQHSNSLKKYLFLTNEVGIFYGQMENSWVDNWTNDKWLEQLSKYKIIVMTARVFLDILNHSKYSLKKVCYLIFDEVHHLTKADDYVQISQHVMRTSDIKILGLTACLIKGVKRIKDIKFTILDLEKKLNCKVITSLSSIACEFSENIKEKIITFDAENFSELVMDFETTIEKIKNVDASFENISQLNNSDGFVAEDCLPISLKKYLSECLSVLKVLGLMPCKLIIDMFIDDLLGADNANKMLDEKTKLCLNEFVTCLKVVKSKIENTLSNSQSLNCSIKCKKLIKLLFDFKSKTDEFEKTIAILIFINERIHALALNELLCVLPKINEAFQFVNSKFIIGHSISKYPKKLQMSVYKQSEILKQYKEKEFNILIATNVVEEGLDVSHCNVVIKFDPPQDFRSYIQSKGRARAQNSQYIIFAEDKDKINCQILHFKQINCEINNILKMRSIENELEEVDHEGNFDGNEDEYDYVPYGENGPRITLNSAASVLNRYIGKLRFNGISNTKILYKFDKNESNFYQASLLLPMPSPFLDEIKGIPCSTKKRAKQFANLEACKILHLHDELDKSLLPYNRYIDDISDIQDNFAICDINLYEKYTAVKLSSKFQNISEAPQTMYLYSIRYTPSVFLRLGINEVSMFDVSLSLGILLPNPIHESKIFMKFPIYLLGGETLVEIKFEYLLELDYENISLLLKCHETLFNLYSERIRKFNKNITYDTNKSKSSIIVTILKDFKIDFIKIKEVISKPYVVNLIENSQNTWIGSVVRPTYINKEFGAFVIAKVCSNMNAESIFTKYKMTYEQICNKKYNIHLTKDEKLLPLVKVIRLTTIQSCINKEKRVLKNNRKLQRINESECYFIPSLTECISLSASLWTHLCIFPTIHHRMNQILTLEEFAQNINFMELTAMSHCFEINFDDCYNIGNIESSTYDSDVYKFINNIFPCFMAKTCNDRCDLEQFEILGDSFLKFISAKYLYHFSDNTENEGKLTQRRSRIISNKNLFRLATKKDLQKYFCYTNFNPKYNYLPPNFVVETIYENVETDKNREFVSIKNKNLADCSEAIIGSLLTNYGMDYSIKFMLWLGLPLLPNDYKSIDIEAVPPETFLENVLTDAAIPLYVSEIEAILNYQFRYKGFIIQAITHPSSISNRKFSCYQRLEFLGDSVIDFLVTVYIMLNNRKLNPGKITNLRSALVNNNTFAYLSAKWGFHKFLNYFDSKMFHVLPKVVDELLKDKLESNNSFLKKSEQYKVVVKVLGDIFESIAGAIFVDSNYDLEAVWRVYKLLMEQALKKFSYNIPKNKISILHEKYPSLKCTFEIQDCNNLVKLTAVLPNDVIIEKTERNKTLCKLALAEELNI